MEIKSGTFGVRVNGELVRIKWIRSETWSISNRHIYNEDTGSYLGLVFEHESGNKTAYDFAGRPVDGELKTLPGMVKRLMRILAERTAAASGDIAASCDACGYDIAPDDDEAQATEENGENINVCGGCADEIGTLVLDARDGKLNRQAPRGKRPEPATANVEAALDRVAASLSLAGPVIERLRKSVVDDEPQYAAPVRSYRVSNWQRIDDVDPSLRAANV